MEHVAHLAAVTVNPERLALQRRIEKVRDPSLVFTAELARPRNAGHPEDHRTQAVDARVIVHILVGRTLGTAVRGVEIQWLRFVGGARPKAT